MATAPSPNDLTRQQLDELDALLQKMLTVPLSAETPPPVASLNAMPQAPLPPSWRVDSPAPSIAQSMPHISLDEESAPMSLKFETPASRVTPAPLPTPSPTPTPTPKPKVVPPSTPAAAPTATPTAAPKTPTPASPTPAVAAPPAPKASQSVAPVPIPQPKPLNVPVAKAPAPASIPTPAATPASAPAIPAPNAVTPVPSAPPVPLPLLPLVACNSLFNGVCGIFGPVGKLLRSGFFKQIYGLAGLGLLVYTAAHVGQVQGWITLPIQLPWPK